MYRVNIRWAALCPQFHGLRLGGGWSFARAVSSPPKRPRSRYPHVSVSGTESPPWPLKFWEVPGVPF